MHYEVNDFTVFRPSAEVGRLTFPFSIRKVQGPDFSPKTLYPNRRLLFHIRAPSAKVRYCETCLC
jgi:hypothetical protein